MKYHRIIQDPKGGVRFVEDEIEDPRPGEVGVRIHAAGVSFADLLMREGIHPEARREPFTPGWDLVGTVERLGDGVTSVGVGETVTAMPIVGGYSEYICLPESELVRVPDGVDPVEAACLGLNYTTAYQMLHRSAKAQSGESALVLNAAGGVGTALLQLCSLHGVTTYGTASRKKLDIVRELGGAAIDYQQEDFVQRVRQLTGSGVDVVFDGIGGWNLHRSFKVLARGGRLIAYGLQSSLIGGRSSLRRTVSDATAWALAFARGFLSRKKQVHLYSIQMLKRRHPDWFRADLTELLALLASGKIKPVIAETLPLEQAATAHEHLSQRGTVGKIVLICGARVKT